MIGGKDWYIMLLIIATTNNILMYDLVIYHGGCNDGFGSALAVWLYVKKNGLPLPRFYPAKHGHKPPGVTGKKVLILDFSLENLSRWGNNQEFLQILEIFEDLREIFKNTYVYQ